jgi:hypothetical protein
MVARTSGPPRAPGGTGWIACELHARLFGRREHVEADVAVVSSNYPGARATTGADGRRLADEFRDELAFDSRPGASLHVTCSASMWPSAHIDLEIGLANCEVFAPMVMQPGLAEIEVDLSGVAPETLSHFLSETGPELADHGISIALRNAPSAVLATHEPFGPDLVGLDLMRAIKQQLDPHGVFARGRLHREL